MSVVSTGVWAGACEEPQEELRTLLSRRKVFQVWFLSWYRFVFKSGLCQHAAVSVTRRRPCPLWSGEDSCTRCVGRSRMKGEAAST